MIVETVNRAIALYNGQAEDSWTPLPASIDGVVSALKVSGYLNASLDWTTDGFGKKLATSSAPVTFVSAGAAGAAPSTGGSGAGPGGATTSGKEGKKKKNKKKKKDDGKALDDDKAKGDDMGKVDDEGKANGKGKGKGGK